MNINICIDNYVSFLNLTHLFYPAMQTVSTTETRTVLVSTGIVLKGYSNPHKTKDPEYWDTNASMRVNGSRFFAWASKTI